MLTLDALFVAVSEHKSTGADLIYSDEVVVDSEIKRLRQFHYKPDFSPHFLTGCNYITHLCVFTSVLLDKAGRYEDGEYEGAGDYDLILRLSEKATKILHIPKVLYIWRGHELSTASGIEEAKPYAIAAGERAVTAHLMRTGKKGDVTALAGRAGAHKIRYENKGESVAVIIPNYEHVEDLKRCLATLYKNAGTENFEVIIVENNSKSKEIFDFYDYAIVNYHNLRVIKFNGKFNFSAVCNLGAKHTTAEHLLLLNNDIEITSPDFVKEMLCYSEMKNVGAVGAKLLYPNGKIQHAGVIVGINGSAGHSHKSHPGKSGGDMYRLCTPQNYLAVTAAAMMTKHSLFEELGGLDEERFAVAFNDVDYCLRLYEKGYFNVMTPHAEAVHHESLSRGSDKEGENAIRFERELENLRAQHKTFFNNNDPFYNKNLTYIDESYGWV